MNERSMSLVTPGFVGGLVMVALGVLFLVQGFVIRDLFDLINFWPLALLLLGVTKIFAPRDCGGRIWGVLFVIAGAGLLLDNLGYLRFRWHDLWPLALITVGVAMLWGHIEARQASGERLAASTSYLKDWAVFGGVQRAIDTHDFRGGDVLALCGGVDLDLRKARMASDVVVIQANAFCGGIELKVPEEWIVSQEGFAFLGGYEDKTGRGQKGAARVGPRLIIKGFAVLGGVEIKN